MRRFFLLAALLLVTGCRTTTGPFARREPQRVDDPRLTIPEQEQRGRDRLYYQQLSPGVLPSTQSELPGPHGR
jgi:hypothetical protein